MIEEQEKTQKRLHRQCNIMMTNISIESGIQQDPLGKAIRREESSILTSSTAVLVFGIWTALKIAAGIVLNQKELNEILDNADVPKMRLLVGFIIAVVAFLIISLAVHIYVGFAARQMALNMKIKPPYLIVSWLLFGSTIFSLVAISAAWIVGEAESAELISIIIDLTFAIALWRLNRSTMKLKKLRRQNTGE